MNTCSANNSGWGNSFSGHAVTELYGQNCFSNSVMREKLPKDIYNEIVAVQNSEKELTLEVAEVVAAAMRCYDLNCWERLVL